MVRIAPLFLVLVLLGTPAAAGTLSGVVRNGTTAQAAAGQDVILIALQGSMEAVATTRTDARGRYSFDRPEIGTAPMLVRVVYKGVNYHQNVPPGRSSADIEIFEPVATQKDLQVSSRMIIVQPRNDEREGAVLLVGEEFAVHNHSKPPASYSREFEFRIPEGATLNQVAAWGPAGMPVVQGTTTKGQNHFGIPFPLKPGENGIRVSYELPYGSNQAVVGAASVYPVDSLMVLAPPTMQIAGTELRSAGNQQGYNVFTRQAMAAGARADVAVSGTAPMPSEPVASGGAGEGRQTAGGEPSARLQTLPERLESLRWVLLGGFAALFALGAVFVWRKPQRRAASAAPAAGHVAIYPAEGAGHGAVSQGLDEIVASELAQIVANELAQIKDGLFRLELRRQAGTISELEYAAERARTEKTLRDLVKGRE
ncbi:MAG: hypothetical protein ACRD5W_07850 [Candidatus Acidiferrales bacterium]